MLGCGKVDEYVEIDAFNVIFTKELHECRSVGI